jgi:hypothetical protein
MPGGRAETLLKRIVVRASRGYRGDPLATLAFYGPDDQHASKIVVGISPSADEGITETRAFWNADSDVRSDAQLLARVLKFLSDHKAKSLVMTDGVCGCPHEEGIDYPAGGTCEYCTFWSGRSREVALIG